jgi:hypothetical protein
LEVTPALHWTLSQDEKPPHESAHSEALQTTLVHELEPLQVAFTCVALARKLPQVPPAEH